MHPNPGKPNSNDALPIAKRLKTRLVSRFRPLVNALLDSKALRGVPNKPLVRALLKQQVWPDASCYDPSTRRLYVRDWNASVSHTSTGWQVEQGDLTLSLDSERSFAWATELFGAGEIPATTRNEQSGASRWRGDTHGFHFFMESVCDMNTAREVFVEQEYRWLTEQFQPGCVVWDIGMNLGMASLLFASDDNVRRVYAFEPMPHTFDVACESLSENPVLSSKIVAAKAGIGADDRTEQFDYTPLSKAGTGMVGILPTTLKHYDIQPRDIQKVDARLLDAATVLRQIRAENPDAPIYVKCDCEGAEFEIIDRLASAGLLNEIEALVVECHKKDPQQVVAQLAEYGFSAEIETKVEGLFYHVRAARRTRYAFGTPNTLAAIAQQSKQASLPKAA